MGQGKRDLSAAHIANACEDSLRRLRTDYIDLYFSHWPDDTVTHEETLGAYKKLVAAGKVRSIGCSNYDEKLLGEALKVSAAKGWPRYDASGFLTGKYRSEADVGKSPRGKGAAKYLDEKGKRILEAMDTVAARTGAALSEIALAWLAAQVGVTAPIASATSVQQVESLARGARLSLDASDLQILTKAGE
jgi:aryl-alcohol dehydrogenase-like predicted oxidoreductase